MDRQKHGRSISGDQVQKERWKCLVDRVWETREEGIIMGNRENIKAEDIFIIDEVLTQWV